MINDGNSLEDDCVDDVVGELFPDIDLKRFKKNSTSISKKSAIIHENQYRPPRIDNKSLFYEDQIFSFPKLYSKYSLSLSPISMNKALMKKKTLFFKLPRQVCPNIKNRTNQYEFKMMLSFSFSMRKKAVEMMRLVESAYENYQSKNNHRKKLHPHFQECPLACKPCLVSSQRVHPLHITLKDFHRREFLLREKREYISIHR